MKIKALIGSALAVTLMGVGMLAGSVVGTGSAAAQSSTATPQATPAAPGNTSPTTPPMDFRGGKGPGHGGFDGGRGGQDATAANASAQITNTTSLINLVKGDLAYANSKMDTTDVQRWVSQADTLLANAQKANGSSQYGQAVAYAEAARELAKTADRQMAQKLGADKLPSYSQLLQRSNDKGGPATTTGTTLTQAQASRMLADTYNRLQTLAAQVKSASNAAEATPYLTDAQNAYKAAYSAYQAANYADAATNARLAGDLSHVASDVVRASTAPANADTPVTVPAPNF